MDIRAFQSKIEYFFKNEMLLKTAFTHSSYANENHTESYERLEYLGDAIVDFLVGEYLFINYPDLDEGYMSRIRAALVCEKTLGELALNLEMDKYLMLGHGAEQAGDRRRISILSDVFEAHIAAMYLDRGFEETKKYLIKIYGELIDETVEDGKFLDYKTKLQEKLQENGCCEIEYRIKSADGPIHHCCFDVEVLFDGKVIGEGTGYSKKEAQQSAACDALKKIKS